MTYTVRYDTKAAEYLTKIPRKTAQRIHKKIHETRNHPHHYWVKLENRKDHKLRIGDYRAIADIKEKQKTINITKIGHRKNIYKK